jgi:hypothetical protein
LDFNRKEIKVLHPPVLVPLMIEDQEIKHTFQITNTNEDMLLGLDFIIAFQVSLVFEDGSSRALFNDVNEQQLQTPLCVKDLANSICCGKSITLSPGVNVVTCHVDKMQPKQGLLTAADCFIDTSITIYEQIVEHNDGIIKVTMINESEIHLPIPEEFKVADWNNLEDGDLVVSSVMISEANPDGELCDLESVPSEEQGEETRDSIEPASFHLPEDEPKIVDWETPLRENNPDFPKSQLDHFVDFLKNDVPDLIAKHELDFGELDPKYGIEHKITLKPGTTPIIQRPYQLNHIRAHQLRQKMAQLEKYNVIEKANSPFGFPVFIVKKASGALRLVFDMRKLNENTVDYHFPVKLIPQLLQEIGSAKPEIFSTLDLCSAFHSVKMDEESSYKCAIITPEAQYRVKRSPFGLKNSPAVFAHAVSAVLADIPPLEINGVKQPPAVCAYADDICVFSSAETHLNHLMHICKGLNKAGLKISPSKAAFYRSEVVLVGRLIDKHGQKALPKHIEAIRAYPEPKNVSSLLRYLGMMAWLSSFIPSFAAETAPLFYLLKKDVPWTWGKPQQAAFDSLKQIVMTRVRRYFVDFNQPLYLNTDSSKFSYASFLFQIRTYDISERPKIEEELGRIESLNELSMPENPTKLPVIPKAGKNCPAPFIFMGDKDQKIDTLDMDDPSKFHLVLPIAFGSGNYSHSQTHWTTYELEIYSFLQSLKYFESILMSAELVVAAIDASSIIWALRLAQSNCSRLNRWLVALSSYPIKLLMTHTKGIKNNVPDSLTRNRIYKLKPQTDTKLTVKTAVKITNPFFPGELCDLDRIQQVLRDDPSLVQPAVPGPPKSKKEKMSLPDDTSNELVVNAIQSFLVADLQDELKLSNVVEEQLKDPFCNTVRDNIEHGKTAYFYILKKAIYRKRSKDQDVTQPGRLLIPKSLYGALFAMFHCDNHVGSTSLYNSLAPHYYLPNMVAKLQEFCLGCHLCSVYKVTHTAKPAYLTSDIRPCPKFEVFSIDIVSGFPSSGYSGCYLSAIEYNTNFKLVLPLKNTTGTEIAHQIERHIIAVFSAPKLFLSDNGPQLLKSPAVSKLLTRFGCNTHLTTAWAPFTHGLIESSHYAINQLLRILLDQLELPWTQLCGFVQLALNRASSTGIGGKSPFWFMFGVDPTELRASNAYTLTHFPDEEEYVKLWNQQHELCKQAVEKAQAQRIHNTQKQNRKLLNFKIGDWIQVRDFTITPKMKIKHRYELQPYRVVRVYPNVLLVESFSGIIKKVHSHNCKRFSERRAELFESLPAKIKVKLGDTMTFEQLDKYINTGTIPDFYKSKPILDPEVVQTRSKSAQKEKEDNIFDLAIEPLSTGDDRGEQDSIESQRRSGLDVGPDMTQTTPVTEMPDSMQPEPRLEEDPSTEPASEVPQEDPDTAPANHSSVQSHSEYNLRPKRVRFTVPRKFR